MSHSRASRLPAARTTTRIRAEFRSTAAPVAPVSWQSLLENIAHSTRPPMVPESNEREVLYVLNVAASFQEGGPVFQFWQRQAKKDGELGPYAKLQLNGDDARDFPVASDRQLLQRLIGGKPRETVGGPNSQGFQRSAPQQGCVVPPAVYDRIFPDLCQTKRFVWLLDTAQPVEEGQPVIWDNGTWQFQASICEKRKTKEWVIDGHLVHGDDRRDVSTAVLLLSHGLVLFPDRMARLDAAENFAWIAALRKNGAIRIPMSAKEEFLRLLWRAPSLPRMQLPAQLDWKQEAVPPTGRISIFSPKKAFRDNQLYAELSFQYGDVPAPISYCAGLVDTANERILLRDVKAEAALREQAVACGLNRNRGYYYEQGDFNLTNRRLTEVTQELVSKGWVVEAEGVRMRRPGSFQMRVSANLDWFELDATIDFEGVSADLPRLLLAARRGERFVTLGDGSQGMLPEEWLARYGQLVGLGKIDGEKLKFHQSQTLLLDTLLAAQADSKTDGQFERLKAKLGSQAKACPPPKSFQGELRQYQREGLGWLQFLRDAGFGGCLADDMGLGKTIQVLALLESRRTRRLARNETRKPSIVVVPKSLVFNWVDESSRFTPKLKVLNYTGSSRQNLQNQFADYDVIVTTYGTLRRDILSLKDCRFDYAILDEAQAIKNAGSQVAKSCRVVRADHRLAMTGTPIENHLGELWSLFEFLNPGMLGKCSAFSAFTSSGAEDSGALRRLAAALRPFILRRTKQQVLDELPDKTEQTLYCEMSAEQKRMYEELRTYYRQQISQQVNEHGIQKAKFQALEALLRLRQTACHPALVDGSKTDVESAKLEVLLEQVAEVVSEGHKVLVFSQFTSLLALVRDRLEDAGIAYEYLDGKSRKRKEKVQRFQEDETCSAFLISLKAGGHGLNLTAADYVFILDPWWNPAVEAQAVDRAHRIGQQRHVFAYRLICRDTVEEKILELQKQKRELAAAVVSQNNSVLRKLTSEDLDLLLS